MRWLRKAVNWTSSLRYLATFGASVAVLLCASYVARAQSVSSVRGKVESLTTAPRGEIDGAVLDDGTVLHWPPHLEDQFKSVAAEGDRVEATGREETGKRGEVRFEVTRLTNLQTKATAVNDAPRPPKGRKGKRPKGPNPRLESRETTTTQGVVRSLATAPRGEIDGAVLDDGTVLHWPPHLEDQFKSVAAEGDRVEATGREETGKRGEVRFEVTRLTNLQTKATAVNDNPRPPKGQKGKGPKGRDPRRAPRPESRETTTTQGVVRSLTTAPRGETDGAVLEDGTVLHWPPHLQNQFAEVVTVGERVEATGWEETGKRGEVRFEVTRLTNLQTNASTGDDRDSRAPGRDREDQLRALQEQVKRLQRQIDRMLNER